MKKLLLIVPIATFLTACGSNESKVTDIAETYCKAIKTKNFDDAKDISKDHVVKNREQMFKNNMGKYSQLFASQNCNVTKIENSDEVNYSVYFGGSKLDSVEIELDKEKGDFFVVSDAFKVDMNLF